jgi:hypothetical protein
MKIDKGCLNLHTEWEAKGDAVNTEHQTTCCYSSYFPRFKGNQKYSIWIYKDGTGLKGYHRNETFLTLGELTEHVRYIQEFLPEGVVGDFEIREENTEELRRFVLTIDVTGENIYHKLVLNWIRYAYELPYSLIIKDALRLNVEEFNNLSLINKFILCSSAYTEDSEYYWRDDMSFGHYSMLLDKAEILNRLEEESKKDPAHQALICVFPREYKEGTELLDVSEDLLETSNWIDGKNFNDRVEIYKHNLKLYEQKEA